MSCHRMISRILNFEDLKKDAGSHLNILIIPLDKEIVKMGKKD